VILPRNRRLVDERRATEGFPPFGNGGATVLAGPGPGSARALIACQRSSSSTGRGTRRRMPVIGGAKRITGQADAGRPHGPGQGAGTRR